MTGFGRFWAIAAAGTPPPSPARHIGVAWGTPTRVGEVPLDSAKKFHDFSTQVNGFIAKKRYAWCLSEIFKIS